MKALIVDDEREICQIVAKILRNEGMDCSIENDVKAARESIVNNNYNVYFIDLRLEDGTGFDLIPLAKKQIPESKVIIISAFDSDFEREKAGKLGADQFIKKPFSKQDILQAVFRDK